MFGLSRVMQLDAAVVHVLNIFMEEHEEQFKHEQEKVQQVQKLQKLQGIQKLEQIQEVQKLQKLEQIQEVQQGQHGQTFQKLEQVQSYIDEWVTSIHDGCISSNNISCEDQHDPVDMASSECNPFSYGINFLKGKNITKWLSGEKSKIWSTAGNPSEAFITIRRLTIDWPKIKVILHLSSLKYITKITKEISEELKTLISEDSSDDLLEAALILSNIQQIYQMPPTLLMRCEQSNDITNLQTITSANRKYIDILQIDDIIYIGLVLLQQEQPVEATLWLEIGLDKCNKLNKDKLNKDNLKKDKLNEEKLDKHKLNTDKLIKDKLNEEKLDKHKLNKVILNIDKLNKNKLDKHKLDKHKLNKDYIKNNEMEFETLKLDHDIEDEISDVGLPLLFEYNYCNKKAQIQEKVQNIISKFTDKEQIQYNRYIEIINEHKSIQNDANGIESFCVSTIEHERRYEDGYSDQQHQQHNHDDYLSQLCRGVEFRPITMTSDLVCRYDDRSSPWLYMMPVKVEEISRNPLILKFHQILTDNDMKYIKYISLPRLKPSLVTEGKIKLSKIRSSFSAKLPVSIFPSLRLFNSKIQYYTGLVVDEDVSPMTAEEFQVSLYGAGGHYKMHHDYFDVYNRMWDSSNNFGSESAKRSHPAGDRLATFMFYTSDVECGGRTIFPVLGFSITPEKGAGILWMNLHSSGRSDQGTLHMACPVIRGIKWVVNKWIKHAPQILHYPCRAKDHDP